MEEEKKTRTIKSAVQPASGILHTKKLTVMLGGIPSTQMAGLGSSFKYEEKNYVLEEAMKEYVLASAE